MDEVKTTMASGYTISCLGTVKKTVNLLENGEKVFFPVKLEV